MKVSVLGAGAVGSMFGALLKRDAPDIDVIVGEENIEGLEKEIRRGIPQRVADVFGRLQSISGAGACHGGEVRRRRDARRSCVENRI